MVKIDIIVEKDGAVTVKIVSVRGEDPACMVMERLLPELGRGMEMGIVHEHGGHKHSHVRQGGTH